MLEVRVSGPVSSGKTTATEIIHNLLTDAGYQVRLTDGRGNDCPPRPNSLRKLPATYTRTAIELVDCETPEPVLDSKIVPMGAVLVMVSLVLTSVLVDGSVPYILTGITASVLSVMLYKAIFNR